MEDDFKVTAQELPAAIESILFISGDPVSVDKLADILNCSKNAVLEALKSLTERYSSNPWSGLEIRRTEDSYAIMTRPSQKKILDRMFGPRQVPPLSQASYETLAVIAYNAAFDRKALNCTMKEFSKFNTSHFFPRSVIFWDSWGMACQTILKQKAYYKNAFREKWISEAGNCMTSAECAFRYITRNSDFIERHTALADVLIEVEIFAKVMRQKKKMRREIHGNPWKLVQPGFCKYVTSASVAG